MSREIKFRAWDKEQKSLLPVSNLYWEGGNAPLQVETSDNGSYREGLSTRFILEQYTGSKDQYGKEIFEGDIIKIAENIAGYVIQDANGQWVIFCDNKEPVKGDVRLGELSEIPKLDLGNTLAKEYCSIVGNIHENLKLFGGEE